MKRTIILLINAMLMTACATQNIPKGSATVTEVYEQMDSSEPVSLGSFEPNLSEYTSEKQNEIKGVFKTLPNPEFVVYVYPHISRGGLPIPGYSTQLKLFSIDQWALPHESIGPQK
jgi:hypothetical protein